MLIFRPLELADIPVIKPFYSSSRTRLCDNTTVLAMWRKVFSTEYCIGNDALFVRQYYDGIGPTFMAPMGGGLRAGIETVLAYCRAFGQKALFSAVSREDLDAISGSYRIVLAEPMRDWSDYLYESRDLREFSGRRFHGQRNHISRFNRQYPDHRFEPLTDIPAARAFIERYYQKNPPSDPNGCVERDITYEVLDHYSEYGLSGGVLYVGESIASVSAGEVIGDTLFVHIEKADTCYAGVYQKTVNLFARTFGTDVQYINREEDMGVPGLRTSKLSYHPVALLEKYMVELEL